MSRTLSKDMMLEISQGNIPGVSHVNKFGRNPEIDTATDPEDVWDGGGLWVPPTAARIHDIVSTSANDSGSVVSSGTATGGSATTIVDSGADFVADGVAVGDTVIATDTDKHSVVTAVATTTLTLHELRHEQAFESGDVYSVVNATSTGASIIHVYGLDENMEEQEEFIIMNGTTNVPTIGTYWRIYRMHLDGAAGRTVSNVGSITATAQTDATVTAQINPGNGQTLMAIYTVPKGKDAYMTQLYASTNRPGQTGGAMADISLNETPHASTDGSGSRVQHWIGIAVDGTSSYVHGFKPYKKFESETDIWVRCESVTDNDTDISAGFDLILVERD